MKEELDVLEQTVASDYKYGFVTEIDTDVVPKGLSEDVIRLISEKKNEPEWMLRLETEGLYSLVENGGANLAKCSLSKNKLPGYYLLCRTKKEKAVGQP